MVLDGQDGNTGKAGPGDGAEGRAEDEGVLVVDGAGVAEIAAGGHVIVRSKEGGIVLAQDRCDFGQRPDVEFSLLAF